MGNPDRLLRLPGFINYPNKNKADAGQPEIMAKLVFASGRTYSLEELERAFKPEPANSAWHWLGPPPARWLKTLPARHERTGVLVSSCRLSDLERITKRRPQPAQRWQIPHVRGSSAGAARL